MTGNYRNLKHFLETAAEDRLFGTLTFQFRDGQLVLIRREETLLPQSGDDNFNQGKTRDGDSSN